MSHPYTSCNPRKGLVPGFEFIDTSGTSPGQFALRPLRFAKIKKCDSTLGNPTKGCFLGVHRKAPLKQPHSEMAQPRSRLGEKGCPRLQLLGSPTLKPRACFFGLKLSTPPSKLISRRLCLKFRRTPKGVRFPCDFAPIQTGCRTNFGHLSETRPLVLTHLLLQLKLQKRHQNACTDHPPGSDYLSVCLSVRMYR